MQLLPYWCLWTRTPCYSCIKITQGVISHVFYVIKSSQICEKPHPESLLWYFEVLKQTRDYGAQPKVLGGRSSWLICWCSQKADTATTVPGPRGTHQQAVPALTEPLGLPQPYPGPHFSPPLPRASSPQGRSRAHLQLPTALRCPAPGPAQPGPPESAMRPARVFGRGEGCSGLLLSPCRTPQIGKAQPPSEDVDSHRLCSFYSSHPQQQDLGRKHCQESVTRDLIRQTAFNLISSTTSAFFFL